MIRATSTLVVVISWWVPHLSNMTMSLHSQHSSSALSTVQSSEQYTIGIISDHQWQEVRTDLLVLLLSARHTVSTAFSSFVILVVPSADTGEATGDIAHSLAAGEASGVPQGLVEGKSAATHKGCAAWVESILLGVTTDAKGVASMSGNIPPMSNDLLEAGEEWYCTEEERYTPVGRLTALLKWMSSETSCIWTHDEVDTAE
jgi:hypothetical protein